MFLSPYPS
jgi:hypothetical protein